MSGPGRKMYQSLEPKPEGAIYPKRSRPQGGNPALLTTLVPVSQTGWRRTYKGGSTRDPLHDSELDPNSANGSIPSRIAWTVPKPPGNAAPVSQFSAFRSGNWHLPRQALSQPISRPTSFVDHTPVGIVVLPGPSGRCCELPLGFEPVVPVGASGLAPRQPEVVGADRDLFGRGIPVLSPRAEGRRNATLLDAQRLGFTRRWGRWYFALAGRGRGPGGSLPAGWVLGHI